LVNFYYWITGFITGSLSWEKEHSADMQGFVSLVARCAGQVLSASDYSDGDEVFPFFWLHKQKTFWDFMGLDTTSQELQ